MGKKVKVTTKCGETFYYDHDQEVDTVEIVEGTRYRLEEQEDHWHIMTETGLIAANIYFDDGCEITTLSNGGGDKIVFKRD